MSTLPPKRPNTRPPIRWANDSETATKFYAIKEAMKKKYPDRRWTNDTTFEYMVKVIWEQIQVDTKKE